MTSPRAALLALALTLPLAACSREEKSAPRQFPIAREDLVPSDDPGELTYRRYCIGCHGGDGRGNAGTTGADFTAEQSPLATKPESELIASVRDGKRGKRGTMPAHRPVLKDEEITAVVRYVQQRFGKPAPAQAPAAAPPSP